MDEFSRVADSFKVAILNKLHSHIDGEIPENPDVEVFALRLAEAAVKAIQFEKNRFDANRPEIALAE